MRWWLWRTAIGLVGLGALVAANAGIGANDPDADLFRIQRLDGPVPVTRLNRRSVEDWIRIGTASNRALGCLREKVPEVETLGGVALAELTRELVNGCLARDGSKEQEDETDALPLTYALHQATGLPIDLEYHCGDVCPKYGVVHAHLVGVSEEDCCALGGTPDLHAGWHVYTGCLPAELSTGELRRQRCTAQ